MSTLNLNGKGALCFQDMDRLRNEKFITTDAKYIKPSSIDLLLDDDVYEIPGVFQVPHNATVFEIIKHFGIRRISRTEPLLPKKNYIVPVAAGVDLPESVYGYANPKSTSGRLDLHVRLLADNVSWYDAIPKGFSGKMWVLISPKTFVINLNDEVCVNQLRLFNKDTRLVSHELESLMQSVGILFSNHSDPKQKIRYKDMCVRDDERSLLLGLDLKSEVVGYRAKKNLEPILYNSVGLYKWNEFFEVIEGGNGYLELEENQFYILSTDEHIMVHPSFACEMASMDERLGEFRAHYAGFIDPGWGYGVGGSECGRPLTLEVRVFEKMLLRHGQPVGRIKFEKLTSEPEQQYDAMASNYVNQYGPKLAKQFKMS